MPNHPAPGSVLGALLLLAERHQRDGESLQSAFVRVTRDTDAGARLYSAFQRAERTAAPVER